MNLLAFDTSTELMSVALSHESGGQTRESGFEGPGGAQASATLLPTILQLLDQAGLLCQQLDAIVFGCGPGSFTGLRTACSVAQGLAFGAGLRVLPVDTLLAVAEDARHHYQPDATTCCVQSLLDARMDEIYAASFLYQHGQWTRLLEDALCRPQDLALTADAALAGNVFSVYSDRLILPAHRTCWPARPTAQALLRLAPALLKAGQAVAPELALPRYVRDKVAKTTQEREAALRPGVS